MDFKNEDLYKYSSQIFILSQIFHMNEHAKDLLKTGLFNRVNILNDFNKILKLYQIILNSNINQNDRYTLENAAALAQY